MPKKLSLIRKIFLGIGVVAFIGSIGLGVYGYITENHVLADIILLLLTAGFGGVLSALQVFPNMLKYIWNLLPGPIDIPVFTKYVSILLVCLLFASLSFNILLFFKPIPTNDKVIKIGVSLPLSGDDMESGNTILNGIAMATDEQKNVGKYTISLVKYDDEGNPNNIDKFKKFIHDPQIAAVIGPFNSGVAMNEIPETNALSIPLISPSTTADCLTVIDKKTKECDATKLGAADNATFFRLTTIDSVRGKKFVEYLSTLYPNGKMAIFRDTTPFGNSFADSISSNWEEKGGKVIFDKTTRSAQEYDQVLKELDPVPDIVLFAGTGAKGILLHSTMQQQASKFLHTAFASTTSIMNKAFMDHSFSMHFQSGSIYTVAAIADANHTPEGREFISQYHIKGKGIFMPASASGYDTAKVVLQAIARAVDTKDPPTSPTDNAKATDFRKEVGKYIKHLNDANYNMPYLGITGIDYHFNDQGDIIDKNGQKPDGEVSIYEFRTNDHGWCNVNDPGCETEKPSSMS